MSLSNPSPIFTAQDVVHCAQTDAKAFGDGSLSAGRVSNCAHVLSGEDGVRIGFPDQRATLSGHIGQVVGIRSKEQMRFVAARPVIARMANQHPLGDGASVDGIGRAMGVDHSSLSRQPKTPVSIRSHSPRPRPASIWAAALVGVMVKALGKRPVVRAVKSFRRVGSHVRGPFARVVRAGVRGANAARLASYPSTGGCV